MPRHVMYEERTSLTHLDETVARQWGARQANLGPFALSALDQQWVRHIGNRLVGRASEIAEEFTAWCAGLFPQVRSPVSDFGALTISVHDNMVTMWQMVASGLEPHAVSIPPSALLWPRKMMHARVPLGTIMRIYYVGHAMIWHRWVQPELSELADKRVNVTTVGARLHSLTFSYLDLAALKVAEQYYAAGIELTDSGSRAQRQAARDILAGIPRTPETRKSLRFPVDGDHRAWILWVSDPRLSPALEGLVTQVHKLLGSADKSTELTITHGRTEFWGWTAGPVEIDAAVRDELRHVVESTASIGSDGARPCPRNSVRMALGEIERGIEGFRGGHEDVRTLRSAMDRARSLPDSVLSTAEAGLAAVLMADPAGARRFARRRLAGLALPTPMAETLRVTLQHYLAASGNHQRVAEELGVHRNTVRHRIQRCEDELGHPVDAVAAELHAALLILSWHSDYC